MGKWVWLARHIHQNYDQVGRPNRSAHTSMRLLTVNVNMYTTNCNNVLHAHLYMYVLRYRYAWISESGMKL